MATIKAGIPKGTRDFLPRQMKQRQYVMDVIRSVYEKHGFAPIETPAIENIETLMGKYGEEGDQLLFKILMRGAKAASGACDLGLRYDLTVPLSRFVAMHQNEIGRIFKRYQMQPVYRADRPGHGRFREFYQCDSDMIGAAAPLPEIALLQAVNDVFTALHFDAITIHINDRRILRAFIDVAGIAQDDETTAITALDKPDKIGREGGPKALAQPLDELDALFVSHDEARQAVAELRVIVETAGHFQNPPHLRVSPELARGLNYYTGAIFEIQAEGLSSSIAGGGRYDHLIGMFSGKDIPAVGISLGFERICVIMEERGMFRDTDSGVDVVIAPFHRDALGKATELSAKIRETGLSCELYPGFDKLAKQFKYANERNARFVAVLGEDEMRANTVTVKNMNSGEQKNVSFEKIGDIFHQS